MCPTKTSTEAKISEFDVTLSVNKDVVWFDVSVNEAHFMYTLNGAHQLGNVEPAQHNRIISILVDSISQTNMMLKNNNILISLEYNVGCEQVFLSFQQFYYKPWELSTGLNPNLFGNTQQ